MKFLINIIYIFFKETFFYSLVHIASLVIDFHVWVPVYLNFVIFATMLNMCPLLVVFTKIVFFKLINMYWVETLFFLSLPPSLKIALSFDFLIEMHGSV